MLAIEKNVPLPTPSGRTPKYPWRMMEVGDSFFVRNTTVKNFSGNTWSAWKKTGFKYAVRAEGDGVRVWRIK